MKKVFLIIVCVAVAVVSLVSLGCDHPDEETTVNPQDKIILLSEAEQAALDAEKNENLSPDVLERLEAGMEYYEAVDLLGRFHTIPLDTSARHPCNAIWILNDGRELLLLFEENENYDELWRKYQDGYYDDLPSEDKLNVYQKWRLNMLLTMAFVKNGEESVSLFDIAE